MLQVYTGTGKGKTTAALGVALRASGYGMKTLCFHFLKDVLSTARRGLQRICPGLRCGRWTRRLC